MTHKELSALPQELRDYYLLGKRDERERIFEMIRTKIINSDNSDVQQYCKNEFVSLFLKIFEKQRV